LTNYNKSYKINTVIVQIMYEMNHTKLKNRSETMNVKFFLPLVLTLVLVLGACAPESNMAPAAPEVDQPMPAQPTPTVSAVEVDPEPTQPDIIEAALADGRFTTLAAALQAAGLIDALQGEGPYTVFAPTDEAFNALPEGTVETLLQPENLDMLTGILLYHVVEGKVMASDVVNLISAETLQGQELSISVMNGSVMIDAAEVIIADIEVSNGVIHVIDAVLLPETEAEEAAPQTIVDIAVADGRFTTLVAALQAGELVEALQGEGPFTVFAPTDEAFNTLPEGTVESLLLPENRSALQEILLYHVVPGRVMASQVVEISEASTLAGQPIMIEVINGEVMIDDAKVIITDIEASNGVIHVIDAVLLPRADIIETAEADGRFTTLLAALEAAELTEALKGEGPFTVFAPTDEAFNTLPEGTIATLLQPENQDQLAGILLYHVVEGKVMAAEVVSLDSAETLQGQEVTIVVEDGEVMIDGAKVIITDILTSNGVVHVIDTVLLP
jgi:transforming growth factor-beta-induced protein